jgi:molybdopterin molybdotransferase
LVVSLGTTWVVGLPGNPVSVLVGWRMFVRPLLEALAGDGLAFGETPLSAHLAARAHNAGQRVQLRPATLARAGTGLEARVIPWRGSHDVVAAGRATVLVRIPPGAVLEAGDQVVVYPLPWRLLS